MPKWDARSRLGIYLGHSPCHAGSVALVLNLKTLHISPQFHIVFDDNFTTVPHLLENEIPPNWKELVEKAESSDVEDYDLAKMWVEYQTNQGIFLQDHEGDLIPLDNSVACKTVA